MEDLKIIIMISIILYSAIQDKNELHKGQHSDLLKLLLAVVSQRLLAFL